MLLQTLEKLLDSAELLYVKAYFFPWWSDLFFSLQILENRTGVTVWRSCKACFGKWLKALRLVIGLASLNNKTLSLHNGFVVVLWLMMTVELQAQLSWMRILQTEIPSSVFQAWRCMELTVSADKKSFFKKVRIAAEIHVACFLKGYEKFWCTREIVLSWMRSCLTLTRYDEKWRAKFIFGFGDLCCCRQETMCHAATSLVMRCFFFHFL